MVPEAKGMRIRVNGIVQGVGFRPFVFNLAERNQLLGYVRNTSNGVDIEISGRQDALDTFLETLRENPPPLARIDRLETEYCDPGQFSSFEIHDSQSISREFFTSFPRYEHLSRLPGRII